MFAMLDSLICIYNKVYLSPFNCTLYVYSKSTYCPEARSGREDCMPKRAPPPPKRGKGQNP